MRAPFTSIYIAVYIEVVVSTGFVGRLHHLPGGGIPKPKIFRAIQARGATTAAWAEGATGKSAGCAGQDDVQRSHGRRDGASIGPVAAEESTR